MCRSVGGTLKVRTTYIVLVGKLYIFKSYFFLKNTIDLFDLIVNFLYGRAFCVLRTCYRLLQISILANFNFD